MPSLIGHSIFYYAFSKIVVKVPRPAQHVIIKKPSTSRDENSI